MKVELKKYRKLKQEFDVNFKEAQKIAYWKPFDKNSQADWFDPEWMFRIPDGFNVVIGNPPYAKIEHASEDRSEQLSTYYGWGGDLYDYFIFAGFAFVSEQGVFTYIANDSYVTFSTKLRIRNLFLQNRLLHLVRATGKYIRSPNLYCHFCLVETRGKRFTCLHEW